MTITARGLCFDKEAIREAVGLRLGVKICEAHTCYCNKLVDPKGLHGLSCRKNTVRQQRHALINDLIYINQFFRLKHQQQKNQWVSCVPTVNAQMASYPSRGKEGTARLGLTIINKYTESHIRNTMTLVSEAANMAAAKKFAKYINLDATHLLSSCHWNGRDV